MKPVIVTTESLQALATAMGVKYYPTGRHFDHDEKKWVGGMTGYYYLKKEITIYKNGMPVKIDSFNGSTLRARGPLGKYWAPMSDFTLPMEGEEHFAQDIRPAELFRELQMMAA